MCIRPVAIEEACVQGNAVASKGLMEQVDGAGRDAAGRCFGR